MENGFDDDPALDFDPDPVNQYGRHHGKSALSLVPWFVEQDGGW